MIFEKELIDFLDTAEGKLLLHVTFPGISAQARNAKKRAHISPPAQVKKWVEDHGLILKKYKEFKALKNK